MKEYPGAVSAAMIDKAIPIVDWEPRLQQLDPKEGPLTAILKHMDSGRIIPVDIEWFEDTLYPLPCPGESCPCRRGNRVGGTCND